MFKQWSAMSASMTASRTVTRLAWFIPVVAQLAACASSPSMRAWELEQEGKFTEAAQLHESEAERYQAQRYLYDTNRALMAAAGLYQRAGDLVKAREVAQRRVQWWADNGNGRVTNFSDGVVDTLPDMADALSALATVCAEQQDGACVSSVGERITGLFDVRAVSALFYQAHAGSSAHSYAYSLNQMVAAHMRVGQQDLALRVRVLELSTGHGLEAFRYPNVIDLARSAGKQPLAQELDKRKRLLESVPFEQGAKAAPYLLASDNPRKDAQMYAAWAQRLERAGGGALAAVARLEAAGAHRKAGVMEGQLRDQLKAQEAQAARQRESEATNQQFLDALRALQAMQPRR